MKGQVMKDSLLTTHMYWSALHCVVELHLSGFHREKCTKKPAGGVLQLFAASKASGEVRHVEDTWCLEGLNRTSQSDGDGSETELGLLVLLAVQHVWVSLRGAQPITSPGVPVGPSC